MDFAQTEPCPTGTGRDPARRSEWTVRQMVTVGSTNDAAATMPAWNAVRADRQTGGRGRHQRRWVSDAGGLWLSAVVPTGPTEQGWAALPLAAGLTVCETLQSLGAAPLRLRWPNDVMTGPLKVAGLLVDMFHPGLAVVGIGINVRNRPDATDFTLSGQVARLEEMMSPVPALDALTAMLLSRLRHVVEEIHARGFSALVPRLNRWWDSERLVEVELDSRSFRGFFGGVDAAGRLQVRAPDGDVGVFSAHQVTRLRECEPTGGLQ